MTKKQFRARLRLLIVLSLLLLGLIGVASGKYAKTVTLDARITFTANLAENVTLREHKAVRQSDGSYTLGTDAVTQNTYSLMPGVDIPKDPYITITGKTDIPAYLFVEVVNNTGNDALSWTVDPSAWAKLSETGNTAVYYYKDVLTSGNCPQTIEILQKDSNGNTVKVSQHMNCESRTLNDAQLLFRVKLIERVEEASAATVYAGYK